MKKILAFILALLLVLPGLMAWGQSDEGYGEDETALGQFVDSFETSGNISVALNVIRNATFEAMELNGTSPAYGNFTNYIQFDIDYNRVGSNLTAFPILLKISDSSGINGNNITDVFDSIGNSYLKIAVTNLDSSVEYYVEVEFWNSSERRAFLWTNPDVSSLENTSLLLHYSENVDNNTGYIGLSGSVVAQNVWDANYLFVSHMDDNPNTSNIRDSTQNDNDGTKVGANQPILRSEGIIGPDQDFDGNNDYVNLGDQCNLITGATWEFIVNRDQLRAGDTFLSKRDGGANNDWQIYDGLGDELRLLAWNLSDNTHIDADFYTGNQGDDVYTAVKYDGSDVYFYKNGTQVFTDDAVNNLINDDIDIHIGEDWFGHEVDGKMDEVRMSNISRSEDWINATQYTIFDEIGFWGNVVEGGYESEGYFSTVDYLSDPLANGSALVSMVNATVPANTAIELQFSEDNSTWVDNQGTPGDSMSLSGGFESFDLRGLNYSTGFYSRFNLSSTDSSVTPRLYQNRLITTIGNSSGGGTAPATATNWGLLWFLLILICVPILLVLLKGSRR